MFNELNRNAGEKRKIGEESFLLNSFNMVPEIEFASFSARNRIFHLLTRPLATQDNLRFIYSWPEGNQLRIWLHSYFCVCHI